MKVQGYFSAWPAILRSPKVIARMEPEPMRVWPSAAAITGWSRPSTGCSGSRRRSASWSGPGRPASLKADQRRARLRPHDRLAALAAGADQDRRAPERSSRVMEVGGTICRWSACSRWGEVANCCRGTTERHERLQDSAPSSVPFGPNWPKPWTLVWSAHDVRHVC